MRKQPLRLVNSASPGLSGQNEPDVPPPAPAAFLPYCEGRGCSEEGQPSGCKAHRFAWVLRARQHFLARAALRPRLPWLEVKGKAFWSCMALTPRAAMVFGGVELGPIEHCGLPTATLYRGTNGANGLPICELHAGLGDLPFPTWWWPRGARAETNEGYLVWLKAIRAIHAENLRPVCPSCGCGRGRVCVMAWDGNEGYCAPAGSLPGHTDCSSCVTMRQLLEHGDAPAADALHITRTRIAR